jgi:hypothetical protein
VSRGHALYFVDRLSLDRLDTFFGSDDHRTTMNKLFVYVLTIGLAAAFQSPSGRQNTAQNNIGSLMSTNTNKEPSVSSARREAIVNGIGLALGSLLVGPALSRADVSDGNTLPKGAAQFNRVLRLRSDLQAVAKRASEGGSDIDDKEWDNIGKFLRAAYAVGEDMKAIAAGVADPDKQKRALEDVDLMRKFARAGDVSVAKKEPAKLVVVLEKMRLLVSDFLDSLSDVPDEL